MAAVSRSPLLLLALAELKGHGGFTGRCMPIDAYPIASLPGVRLLAVGCSRNGQCETHDSVRSFERYMRKGLPAGALGGVCAVFGLGDSFIPKLNACRCTPLRPCARWAGGFAPLAPANVGAMRAPPTSPTSRARRCVRARCGVCVASRALARVG
jgi:hypothetical protein